MDMTARRIGAVLAGMCMVVGATFDLVPGKSVALAASPPEPVAPPKTP
jgi:hypothetical protein